MRALNRTIAILALVTIASSQLIPQWAPLASDHEIGDWLNGDSIYGTRGGPWLPGDYGVSTFRGTNVYLHILEAFGEPDSRASESAHPHSQGH